ncbi:MAG TPA: TMEM175 family protein [Polyangiales bacterium]|nr:TMEM175 family protein [Polyangiales bacterium]
MAIAITLLILEVRVPEHGPLFPALLQLWPSYLAYLASFFTIGIIWLNHHAFFGRVRQIDHVLHWWNLLLLLTVSFLPFPTAVLAAHVRGEGADARCSVVFYGLIGVLMTFPWVLMWRRLAQRPELMEPEYDRAFAVAEGRRAWVGVVVYGLCMGVGMISPVAALVLFAAVAVFYGVTSQGLAVAAKHEA